MEELDLNNEMEEVKNSVSEKKHAAVAFFCCPSINCEFQWRTLDNHFHKY